MPVNFQSEITITRALTGGYVEGEWVGATGSVIVNGNIQSASEGDVSLVSKEVGRSVRGLIVIRCNEPLYTDRKTPGRAADRLTWQGEMYEVIRVICRNTLTPLIHYRAYAELIDSQAEDASL